MDRQKRSFPPFPYVFSLFCYCHAKQNCSNVFMAATWQKHGMHPHSLVPWVCTACHWAQELPYITCWAAESIMADVFFVKVRKESGNFIFFFLEHQNRDYSYCQTGLAGSFSKSKVRGIMNQDTKSSSHRNIRKQLKELLHAFKQLIFGQNLNFPHVV